MSTTLKALTETMILSNKTEDVEVITVWITSKLHNDKTFDERTGLLICLAIGPLQARGQGYFQNYI